MAHTVCFCTATGPLILPSQVCNETYGLAPDVVITGDKRLTIPYVPSHFDYMVYEVLKNSSRAVVERHLQQSAHSALERRLPAIHARICSGEGQVTLRCVCLAVDLCSAPALMLASVRMRGGIAQSSRATIPALNPGCLTRGVASPSRWWTGFGSLDLPPWGEREGRMSQMLLEVLLGLLLG